MDNCFITNFVDSSDLSLKSHVYCYLSINNVNNRGPLVKDIKFEFTHPRFIQSKYYIMYDICLRTTCSYNKTDGSIGYETRDIIFTKNTPFMSNIDNTTSTDYTTVLFDEEQSEDNWQWLDMYYFFDILGGIYDDWMPVKITNIQILFCNITVYGVDYCGIIGCKHTVIFNITESGYDTGGCSDDDCGCDEEYDCGCDGDCGYDYDCGCEYECGCDGDCGCEYECGCDGDFSECMCCDGYETECGGCYPDGECDD